MIGTSDIAPLVPVNGDDSRSGLSRRRFLTVATAGLAAGGMVLGSPRAAQADILDTLRKVFDLDPIVVNYAWELEELQMNFFQRALRSPAYGQLEARERSNLNLIAMQDRAHFEALDMVRSRIGARARDNSASHRPRVFRFPASAFRTRQELLPLAVEIKENAVAAYHGAVDLLREQKAVLQPAAAIAGVDGRHLVVLREMAGLDPIPTSFELQVSPQTVGNRLARYGFKGGGMRNGGF